ncbi:MAG: helix-turn-helix transcriptional regulator [Treponema sp.]|nr:helix-turn-helix transcriptional regulator [Treponema sp.]
MNDREIRQILSSNIKLQRKRKGLSQAKLAEKMHISAKYVSDIETCRGWVSPVSLSKLSHALGIEVYELFRPQKAKPNDKNSTVNKCLDDVTLSLKQGFEKFLDNKIKDIRQTY